MRIASRVDTFEDLGDGRGVKATLVDGTEAYGDVLVGADGVWSQVRKQLQGLGEGAGGFAASGAAGGAISEAEARQAQRDTVKIAAQAERRFSGFTCYAALAPHRASNIEDVSYQILLGSDKYIDPPAIYPAYSPPFAPPAEIISSSAASRPRGRGSEVGKFSRGDLGCARAD